MKLDNIEDVVKYWDDRMKNEADYLFGLMGDRKALLASDITWSIRRLKSENEKVTVDRVFDKLLEHYRDRWESLVDKGIKETSFKEAVKYYDDWEGLSEEEKTPIREYRKDRYLKWMN